MSHFENFENIGSSKAYEISHTQAEKLVNNKDELQKFLDNLEKKLESVPTVGKYLSNIPILVSMVKSYVEGKYTLIPIGSLIGIVTALVYLVNPFDLIHDAIPGIGHIDDAMVIAITMAFVGADVETYKQWRNEQEKNIHIDATIK